MCIYFEYSPYLHELHLSALLVNEGDDYDDDVTTWNSADPEGRCT